MLVDSAGQTGTPLDMVHSSLQMNTELAVSAD